MAALQHQCFAGLRGELRFDEPMSAHTTWRVGGPADHYYRPADIDDLATFLRQLPEDEPLFWLGLGSNILVRDGGVRGTVIAYFGGLNEIIHLGDGLVKVGAGLACAKIARFCAKQGLVGAEFLSGIPGAMGGALAMNAGAFGGETWPLVERVEVIDRHGKRLLRDAAEYQAGYRRVVAPVQDEWFVAAWLKLAAGDSAQAMMDIRQLLARRAATQPTQQANAGSVFRNPPGDYAARLIEACGLKGESIGDAVVSEKHANFIVNRGSATASDIEQLIHHVSTTVKQQQGIELIREVHLVGADR